jgi:catechol 2,3-dioxygenase-like lactoylglutathione lyase family enzyme
MAVAEIRVALTTEDYERVVAFYRDGLGLDPAALWTNDEGGRGQMLRAGRGTLEIFDPSYAASVDQIEVGRRVSGQIRFCFEVMDIHAAVKRAVEYGARLVHEPMLTPWNDLNARVESPDGLQVTLFQVVGS